MGSQCYFRFGLNTNPSQYCIMFMSKCCEVYGVHDVTYTKHLMDLAYGSEIHTLYTKHSSLHRILQALLANSDRGKGQMLSKLHASG